MSSPCSALRTMMLAGALAAAAVPAHALDLTIEVVGARSATGIINTQLFVPGAGWLQESSATQIDRTPATSQRATVVWRGLAAGRYAIASLHDENGNGKLDANFVGLPTEPYGFSRDARGILSAPSFDDAAIDLQADTTITIQLR